MSVYKEAVRYSYREKAQRHRNHANPVYTLDPDTQEPLTRVVYSSNVYDVRQGCEHDASPGPG